MKKIFFIYTNPQFLTALYQPVMEREFGSNPEVKVNFVCDNSILADSLENNTVPTASVEKRLERLIDNCIEAGADCVVVGCTVMNVATQKIAASKNVPVMNIDDPMIEKLVADNRKHVIVLSHARDNAETIERQLAKKNIAADLFVIPGAGDANRSGDKKKLEILYRDQIVQLDDKYDAIVLAHISADDIQIPNEIVPIYRSGAICIEKMNQVLN